MGIIRVLPDTLASQVAAGEVVERPASVVKELVENSLDAGATRIEVRADRGGLALLRVSDDGCGMNRDDALMSLQRHATSKLRTVEDLGAITTLGFRGEALPSIASVSRFTLQTREADAEAGTEIAVDSGRLLDVHDWGGAPGTAIEVRGLFARLPARRKFLRSENTEFGHIEQSVRVQALAHPAVGVVLIRDGRIIFQLPPHGSLRTRIDGLVGPDVAGRLVECREQVRNGLVISGWLGAAGFGRSDRSLTLTFINGRPVESPVLHYGLRAGYGDGLARGRHPVCVLFISMSPLDVDVNVHPAKKEVRFRDGLGVQAALAAAIQESLRDAASGATRVAPSRVPAMSQARSSPARDLDASRGGSPAGPVIGQPDDHPIHDPTVPRPRPLAAALPPRQPDFEAGTAAASEIPPSRPPSGAERGQDSFQLIGTLQQSYALFEGDEGLVMMELRAAHERVLYEELRGQAAGGAAPMQALLVPLTVRLTPRDFAILHENSAALRRLGFSVEEFGENTIKIDGLPATIGHSDPAEILNALVEDLSRGGESGARRRLDTDALAAAVCARAIPRGTAQSPAEIESLLRRLLSCEMPYCDPAGRPTLIQTSFPELARKFGRRP